VIHNDQVLLRREIHCSARPEPLPPDSYRDENMKLKLTTKSQIETVSRNKSTTISTAGAAEQFQGLLSIE